MVSEQTEIDLLLNETQAKIENATSDEERKRYELKLNEAKKLQIKYIEQLKKLKLHKDTHGGEYFKPLPHQQQMLDFYYAGKIILILQGAGQIGKTILGCNFVQANCLGYLPWDKAKKTLFTPPIKVRIICTNWERHAAGVIVPKLYEYFIFDEMVKLGTDGYGKKNQIGVEYLFAYKNGSTIELVTSKIDTEDHAGWTGHIVWADEPLPKDVYDENIRGLMRMGGVYLNTLTSVNADYDWILEDIIESPKEEMQRQIGCIRKVHAYANTYIPKEQIDATGANYSPQVFKARIEGNWYSGQGKVWPEFNYELHTCDDFKIPTDWPIVPIIDYHACIEQAIGFYAIDKPGYKYVIDEVWQKLIPAPEEIADEIIRRKISNAWRIDRAYIDPYSEGAHKMVLNRIPNLQDAYSVIKNRLAEHGIILIVADKNKNSGIENVRGWLRGVNGLPSLRIFRKCKRHIYEMKKWEIDENGKPEDKDDHMCENIYRYSLTGTQYTDPQIFKKKYEPTMAAVA